MPTICEIKMELKELNVKGITGKKKAELMAMLENAKAPKPKGVPKIKRKPVMSVVAPAPAPEPEKPGQRLMAEIRALVDEAKAKAREGASAKELTDFYNKKISPKIDLYGAEYLGHGGASEIADELFEEISAEYRKHKDVVKPVAEPEPVKPKREIEWSPSQKAFFDYQREQREKAEKRESEITEALKELKQVMAEARQASKEGGLYKRRENWKGKAGFMKKIDKLWEKFPAGIDLFRQEIPFNFGWNPKEQSGESHEHYMYRTTGRNIDWCVYSGWE